MQTKWNDDRKNVFAGCVFELLRYDVSKGRFDILQKLYEAAGVSKSAILKQERKNYYTDCEPSETVYYNICYILGEKVAENENLRDMYIKMYSERYPEIVERANCTKRMIFSGISPDAKEYRAEWNAVKKMEEKYVDRDGTCVFNIFRDTLTAYDDMMWNRETIRKNFLTNKTPYEKFKQKSYQYESESDSAYRFADTNELIYKSRFFKRFFNKIRQIYTQISLFEKKEHAYELNDIIHNLFNDKNWPVYWFSEHANEYSRSEEVLSIYCRVKIDTACHQLEKENKPITEEELENILMTADYKNEDFIRDTNVIMMNCGMISLTEEFKRLYCNSFSWEQNKDFSHQRVYRQYEDKIQKKDSLIESLRKENEAMKEEIQKNQAKTFSGKTRKEKRLEKALKEKEKENEELKKKLEMAEQFAKAAVRKVETGCDINLEELKRHKYLFCAENEDILQQLNQYLPESIYVSNTTTNFKNVKVDAVVIPTKFISHGMYYKVKNVLNVPLIHCNGNSSKTILCEIQNEMNKKQTA